MPRRPTGPWHPLWNALLALLVLGTLAIHFAQPVRDGDLFWQMAYGRYLLENKTLIPDHTAFTWTPTQGETVYCAWLPEIGLYLVHQAAGLAPLFALRYLCLLVFLAVVWLLARRLGVLRHPLVALISLAGILMSESAAYIKPEIVSYALMTLTVALWMYVKSAGERGARYCYAFPVIILVWVNSHGGFIFGALFLVVMFAGESLNRRTNPAGALPVRVWRHLGIAMVLSALAVLVTPYGIRYPIHLLHALPAKEMTQLRTVRAYLSIFDPRVSHLFYPQYLALAVLIFLALLSRRFSLRRIDWALLATNVVFALIYTRFLRSTYYWVPVFALTAVYLLAQRRGALWPAARGGRRLVGAVITILCLLIAGRAAHATICHPVGTRWFGFGISYQNPVVAAEFIREHLSDRRLGNDYGGGGYLLWALYPDTKVMIDPRSFPFEAWFDEFHEFSSGKNVAAFMERFPCDVWCLNMSYQRLIGWFLRSPDWVIAFYGPSAVVFVRDGVPFPERDYRASPEIANIKNASQALYVFRFAIAIRDWRSAETVLAGVRERALCPPDRRQVSAMQELYDGNRAYYRGDYRRAAQHLEASRRIGYIKDDALLARTYNHLTTIAWAQGEEHAALAAAQAAVAARPRDLPSLYNAGVIGWYLQASGQDAARQQDGRARAASLLNPQAAGAWQRQLAQFLQRARGDPGASDSLLNVAAAILRGQYRQRPALAIQEPIGP